MDITVLKRVLLVAVLSQTIYIIFSSFPCVQQALLNSSYVISWFVWYLVKTIFYEDIYFPIYV